MMEICDVLGSIAISADKDISTIRSNWIKSLYEGSKKDKPVHLLKEFQFKILLGEYLSEELYRLSESPDANKVVKKAFKDYADIVGCYFDKPILLAMSCCENKVPLPITRKEVDIMDRAIAQILDYIPNPQDVLDAFAAKYNLKFQE